MNASVRPVRVKLVGMTIFGATALTSLIWPLGNIADNYGGDRGPGNNGLILAAWAVGSAMVYLSQKFRWASPTDGSGDVSVELVLASIASLAAVHIGVWSGLRPHSLNVLFFLVGSATALRAIWIEWGRLSALARVASVVADAYLAMAAALNLFRLGFSDLGFSNYGPVPEWAGPLTRNLVWLGLAIALPPLTAMVVAVWSTSRPPATAA